MERRGRTEGTSDRSIPPRDEVSSPRYVRRERSDGSTYRLSSAARSFPLLSSHLSANRLRPTKCPSAGMSTLGRRRQTRLALLDRKWHPLLVSCSAMVTPRDAALSNRAHPPNHSTKDTGQNPTPQVSNATRREMGKLSTSVSMLITVARVLQRMPEIRHPRSQDACKQHPENFRAG